MNQPAKWKPKSTEQEKGTKEQQHLNNKKTTGQAKHDCVEMDRKLTLLQAETARLEDIINEQRNTIRIYKMRLAASKDHQTDQRDACQTQQDRNREVHNRLTNLEIDNLKLRMTHLEAGQKLYEHRMSPTHNLCPQCTRNNHIVTATCHRPTTNLVTSEILQETTTLIDQPTTQRENTPKQMVNTTKATTHQIYDRPHQDHWYNDRDNLPLTHLV